MGTVFQLCALAIEQEINKATDDIRTALVEDKASAERYGISVKNSPGVNQAQACHFLHDDRWSSEQPDVSILIIILRFYFDHPTGFTHPISCSCYNLLRNYDMV